MNQIQFLENLYNFYNRELFENKLPDVVISFSRDSNVSGVFLPEKWQSNNNPIHEISINPDYFEANSIDFHQTIVHEMCHIYQFENGTPGKNGYHNKEFSEIMFSIGLQTSDSGTENGNPTGYKMSDYIIEDGSFVSAFKKIQEHGYTIPSVKPIRSRKKHFGGVRSKYTCKCGYNIWGKSGLKIMCKNCKSDFEEN